MGYKLKKSVRNVEIDDKTYQLRAGDVGILQLVLEWLKKASNIAPNDPSEVSQALDNMNKLCDDAKSIVTRAMGIEAAQELLGDGYDFASAIDLMSIISIEMTSKDNIDNLRRTATDHVKTLDTRAKVTPNVRLA